MAREENEPISFDLTGQTVVIVGGTSGMGLASARAAAALGARIVAGGHSKEKIETARSALGSGHDVRRVDVSDEKALSAFFDPIEKIDHLMVTASPGSTGEFKSTHGEDARSYMSGKFWTGYECCWLASKKIKDNGSITLISGGLASRPKPGTSVVSAAQAATEAFVRALSVELAPIRANVIVPGFTDSAFLDFMSEEDRAKAVKDAGANSTVGRAGVPADIGHAAVALMTNPYIAGATLTVDGGKQLK